MRRVAAFALSHSNASAAAANVLLEAATTEVTTWLQSKSAKPIDVNLGQHEMEFSDGRRAQLTHDRILASTGELRSWELQEQSQPGEFATSLTLGRSATDVLFCTLAVGRR